MINVPQFQREKKTMKKKMMSKGDEFNKKIYIEKKRLK